MYKILLMLPLLGVLGCFSDTSKIEYPAKTKSGQEIKEIVRRELEDFEWKRAQKEASKEKVAKIWEQIKKHQEEAKGDKHYEFWIPLRLDRQACDIRYQENEQFPQVLYADINYRYTSDEFENYWWGVCKIVDNADYIAFGGEYYTDETTGESKKKWEPYQKRAKEQVIDLYFTQRCHFWLNLYDAKEIDGEVVLYGSVCIAYDGASDRKPLVDWLELHGAVSDEYRNEHQLREYFGRK